MSQASSDLPLDKIEAARAMGLVVCLRFLLWGAAVGALTGFGLIQAGRFPALLSYLAFPMMLAIYLAGTGQVLLLLRLEGHVSRALALAPVLAVGLLCAPAVLKSPSAVAAVLGVALAIYLQAFLRQARSYRHTRAVRWFALTARASLVFTLLSLLVPRLAGTVTVVGGLILALALVVGWQIWLAELRDSLARV